MDKFLADASTAYWWITAVLVGLVINLASAYLKEPIDHLAAQLSAKWRARNAGLREARRLHVEMLRKNMDARVVLRAQEARLRLKALYELGRGCILLLMIGLMIVTLTRNPQPLGVAWMRYTIDGLFIVFGVLFFIALTSAATHHGRAEDFERQLREVGSA